eukprot:CAMPEP_0185277152 /NCGR_PEP_ID=MMETSP1359-20130426/57948_1 /TAXON_ID=552665 /ORGANISM="Bigelowiella longifila, Strain CCMP242" /LENGTH=78 /DNA_ID=CAMNT_0027871149 /DNA_START=57 /DNA_END=289 /DNA_ORIENTATION=+
MPDRPRLAREHKPSAGKNIRYAQISNDTTNEESPQLEEKSTKRESPTNAASASILSPSSSSPSSGSRQERQHSQRTLT